MTVTPCATATTSTELSSPAALMATMAAATSATEPSPTSNISNSDNNTFSRNSNHDNGSTNSVTNSDAITLTLTTPTTTTLTTISKKDFAAARPSTQTTATVRMEGTKTTNTSIITRQLNVGITPSPTGSDVNHHTTDVPCTRESEEKSVCVQKTRETNNIQLPCAGTADVSLCSRSDKSDATKGDQEKRYAS